MRYTSVKRMPYLATGLLGLLVAIFDEWYQTALPHRSGQDVLIDLVGILIALTLVKIKYLEQTSFRF